MSSVADSEQQALFDVDTCKKIDVIKASYNETVPMSYKELFTGFNHLRVITFSYGISFIEEVAGQFDDLEIVIGTQDTVHADLAQIAIHQQKQLRLITPHKKLVSRIENGTAKLYLNREKRSHEKTYIMWSDDSRCRVVLGSANFSKRAFNGAQAEVIICFDNDYEAFLDRTKRFDEIASASTTSFLTETVINDYIDAKDDADKLLTTPVMKPTRTGDIFLVEPESQTIEAASAPTFDISDLTDEEKELLASIGSERIKADKVSDGGYVVRVTEVTRFKQVAKESATKIKEKKISFPRFEWNAPTLPTLNGIELAPEPNDDWKLDAQNITSIITSREQFIGDTEFDQRQYFKVLSFMFTAPFMTEFRVLASRHNFDIRAYPRFLMLYGDSNCGKTAFVTAVLKLMYGGYEQATIPPSKFTQKQIRELDYLCDNMCLFIDDIKSSQFSRHAENIVKDDLILDTGRDAEPIYVLTTNDIPSLKSALAKRCVATPVRARIGRTEGIRNGKSFTDAVDRLTLAFYNEYLERISTRLDDLREAIISTDCKDDLIPDVLEASSKTLHEMFEEVDCDSSWNQSLTFEDFVGEVASSVGSCEMLREAYRVDPKQFSVRPHNTGVEYRPNGYDKDMSVRSETKHRIYEELPVSVDATYSNGTIIFKNQEKLEDFLGIEFKTPFIQRVKNMFA